MRRKLRIRSGRDTHHAVAGRSHKPRLPGSPPPACAFNAIGQVGNYGEIFERNLGAGSSIGLARGVNDQWSRRGLMYAPPIR